MRKFNPEKVPVAAVSFLQEELPGKQASRGGGFFDGCLGGYVIYRLYPEARS